MSLTPQRSPLSISPSNLHPQPRRLVNKLLCTNLPLITWIDTMINSALQIIRQPRTPDTPLPTKLDLRIILTFHILTPAVLPTARLLVIIRQPITPRLQLIVDFLRLVFICLAVGFGVALEFRFALDEGLAIGVGQEGESLSRSTLAGTTVGDAFDAGLVGRHDGLVALIGKGAEVVGGVLGDFGGDVLVQVVDPLLEGFLGVFLEVDVDFVVLVADVFFECGGDVIYDGLDVGLGFLEVFLDGFAVVFPFVVEFAVGGALE